ncbi:MAG: glycosyltransferase [Caldilineaceae bacterium]|nr:glycosyltransferase [Caldilineaceae bacterium]
MNDMPPLLSVCCITYNHAAYIEQTIKSFLMQKTDFPIEIIIHDDCSTDRTPDIIREYQASSDLIVPILQTENQKSKGKKIFPITFERARGKYIAMCEGDDYWTDPTKLQKQVAFLDANPAYVICAHDATVVDRDGHVLQASKLLEERKRDLSADELVKTGGILTLTACFRNLLREYPPEFYRVLNGDTFLFSILGMFGGSKYMGSEIAPAAYRRHQGGVWSQLDQWNATFHRAQTFYWLSRYYERIDKQEYAAYFRKLYQRTILRTLRASHSSDNLKRTCQEFVSRRENLTNARWASRFTKRLLRKMLSA